MNKKTWLALMLALALMLLAACGDKDDKKAAAPTAAPTAEPTKAPTADPTEAPTAEPTAEPVAQSEEPVQEENPVLASAYDGAQALIADSAGKITSAEISREPTKFIASTIITAVITAISRLYVPVLTPVARAKPSSKVTANILL